MPPKKVTDKALAVELERGVRHIYSTDRDKLTVNYTRQFVEKKLKLKDGFLKEGDWKAKSKEMITAALTEIENEAPDPSQSAATHDAELETGANIKKKRTKKEADEPPAATSDELSELSEKPAKKRKLNKKVPKKKAVLSDDESEVSNFTGASDSEEPPTKKPEPATPKKKQARKASIGEVKEPPNPSPDDNTSELSEIPEEPQERKSKPTRSILGVEEFSELSDEPQERKSKAKSGPAKADESVEPSETPKAKKAGGKKDGKPKGKGLEYDDGSELSEINDEPPKRQHKSKAKSKRASRKRKSKEPAAKGERKAKSSAKAPAELSPDEAQIKQLQSQLVKCGLRKIWGFELKKYGDDSRAKIKHLKNMLTDVGMTGRFSESRAREIKEQRELLAEIAEVKEGDKSWGVGGRPSRRRAATKKSIKERTDDEDADAKKVSGSDKEGGGAASGGDDNYDDSDDDEAQPKARARASARHRADLAFLDDESDSD
ncbi:hypothetical protein B0T24DRAFT_620653 [Lasiosphaeria ovina]|uniref:Transcriptional regulator n=1 Tax=Lasiosphaeria ovina TaxID=92902 RepID=A0AAE0KIN5_9PEZI|nr:hypothetical protein B0T24DRAFT_620653 [Lasiosphaeria ovina]